MDIYEILSVLGLCIANVPLFHCESTWVKTGVVGGEMLIGRLATLTLGSLSQCATECHVRSTCTAFGYGSTSGKCLLHDARFEDSLVTSSMPQPTDSLSVIEYYANSCDQAGRRVGKYVEAVGGCVWRTSERLNFTNALTYCASENSQLPTVKTQAALDFFYSHRAFETENSWMGAQQDSLNSSLWWWLSGEVIGNDNGGQFWLNKQNPDPKNHCIMLKYRNSSAVYGLVDARCANKQRFYCVLN